MPSTDRLILSIVFRLRVEGNQKGFIDDSYQLVVAKLTKKERAQLSG